MEVRLITYMMVVLKVIIDAHRAHLLLQQRIGPDSSLTSIDLSLLVSFDSLLSELDSTM